MSEPPEEITLDYFAGWQIYTPSIDPVNYMYLAAPDPIPYRLVQVKEEHVFTDFSTHPATVEIKKAWVYSRYRGR
jgi:hypothetical protein